MARINGVVLSDDETFRTQIGALLRAGAVPIATIAESGGQRADIVVIDARADLGAAMARAESVARQQPRRRFRHRLRLHARPDPAGDAVRRERVLRLAAARNDVP